MNLQFSRFYTIFSVLVVFWLYVIFSFFTVARSLKFRRLRLKEDFDTIAALKSLVA